MSDPVVARQLFEWIEQNFPDGDIEDRLQRALAEIDNLASLTGESPEVLRKKIRTAMEHSAKRTEFPSRSLRLGSNPVRDADVRVGAVYFRVGFHDPDLLIPYLMPYVFAGFGLSSEGDDNLAYFQDIDSFAEGIRFGDGHGDDDADFTLQSRPISGMYTFDVALEAMMRVALSRESVMKRSYQKIRLESGEEVEIKAHTYVGGGMYELNYFTHIPLDDGTSLRAEMLEVWKHHSTTEDIDNPKIRAVTANHKLEFVDQVLPKPVTIAFRREGDAWVEFDWPPWGDEE